MRKSVLLLLSALASCAYSIDQDESTSLPMNMMLQLEQSGASTLYSEEKKQLVVRLEQTSGLDQSSTIQNSMTRSSAHQTDGSFLDRLTNYLLGKSNKSQVFLTHDMMRSYYYGPLFFGDDRQELMMMYDTGSNYVVADGIDCSSCYGAKYDYRQNEGKGFRFSDDKSHTNLTYGSFKIEAFYAFDTVCLSKDEDGACAKDFGFLEVYDEVGLPDKVTGILGLSSGGHRKGFDSPPMYVEALKEAGYIDKAVFGMHFTGSAQVFAIFGGDPEDEFSEGHDFHMIDVVKDDFWWTSYITGISFGDETADSYQEFSVKKTKIFADSGMMCSSIPQPYFNWLGETLGAYATTVQYDNSIYKMGYIIPCQDQYKIPKIRYLIDGYWYEESPLDYLYSYSRNVDTCSLCIFENPSDEYWILGFDFLKGYYAHYDYDNKQFGFAPQKLSGKSWPTPGKVPSEQAVFMRSPIAQFFHDNGLVVGLGAFVVIAIVVFVVIDVCYQRDKKRSRKLMWVYSTQSLLVHCDKLNQS